MQDRSEAPAKGRKAALFYHPEGFTTSGPKLMGRHAAGESFLRAMLSHGSADDWWVQVEQAEHAEHFLTLARQQGRHEPVRRITRHNLLDLQVPGAIYYPGPRIGQPAWERSLFGHHRWSLCGITHTTSSAMAMDSIVELITAPVQPWDALICTSTAVKSHVERLLQLQVDQLRHRLGITRLVLPQLPVIPLGIHTADFEFDAATRAHSRKSIEADEDTLVVLFMGRLSFHAKAHPLAMYQALEAAAQRTRRKLLLIECGWHATAGIERSFAQAAAAACPSVRVGKLDGRKPEQRAVAWSAADVFCSLSDNIQETFGITPIEAMAAGLPVVVSDWDGYRDTVRDGVDGFRIPTCLPLPGQGDDLATRHALGIDNYDHYCGHTCMFVAVDVAAAANAFVRLFESSTLREQMGQAGRQRARDRYDWRVVWSEYESLWGQLAELRARAAAPEATHPWPARSDPFHGFAAYPSRRLTPDSILGLVEPSAALTVTRCQSLRQLGMVSFAATVLPTLAVVQQISEKLEGGPCRVADLLQGRPPIEQTLLSRALVWMLKMNLLTLEPAELGQAPQSAP